MWKQIERTIWNFYSEHEGLVNSIFAGLIAIGGIVVMLGIVALGAFIGGYIGTFVALVFVIGLAIAVFTYFTVYKD